jgi:ribonuclease HII
MNTKFEQQKFKDGYSVVIGCDEVGRGCLAGPVVAAAVIFDCSKLHIIDHNLFKQIKDSKQLSPKKREELACFIKQNFQWGIGEVSPEEIDKINIHQATLLAMRKAVQNFSFATQDGLAWESRPKFLVIDGKFVIPSVVEAMDGRQKFDMEQEAIVDGDNKIFSIAAASIVAKVYRDELMRKMDLKYPQYAFAQHKGYGTLHHRNMLKQRGLCPIHRRSFCKKYY